MNTLIVDNIDSFTYNLVQYVGMLGGNPTVVENTGSLKDVKKIIKEKKIDRIIISPGPKRPEDAGVSNDVIREFGPSIPILGVCLGHQCIGSVFGARIRRAKTLLHGKVSEIRHDGKGVFAGIANPLKATRYHSLVVSEEGLPECLIVTARSIGDGEIMGIRHRTYPIEGLQFHPESILTEDGLAIIGNFLGARK
jgi:anthranilate synthase/aminodeoxychorismate synthase-like glutamine amidotransferase